MSEKPIEKKVVSRTVAVVCVVIIIVLGIGLVLTYQILQNQINSLNANKTNLQSQVNYLQSQIDTYSAILIGNVTIHKYQILVNFQTISQPFNNYTYWTFSASYAGYISVYVEKSTTTNTYVRAIYSAYGVSYDNQISVGANGTAIFPIFPGSESIEIRVGNTNLLSGATETVTITYYY